MESGGTNTKVFNHDDIPLKSNINMTNRITVAEDGESIEIAKTGAGDYLKMLEAMDPSLTGMIPLKS